MGNIFAATQGGLFDNTLTSIQEFNPGTFGFKVVNESWVNIQPTGPLDFNTANIDAAQQAVAAYGNGLMYHLRVWVNNINAPSWAINQLGPPIFATDNKGNLTQQGQYWTGGYMAMIWLLAQMLGDKYDSDPLLGGVSIFGPSTRTDEPFNFSVDATTVANLYAAGYSDAQMIAMLQQSILETGNAFPTTAVEYTFNPFRRLDGIPGGGRAQPDETVTAATIGMVRSQLGQRGVPAYHALWNEVPDSNTQDIYNQFQVVGGPLNFQMKAIETEWAASIPFGCTFNPERIELWNGIPGERFTDFPQGQLDAWKNNILGIVNPNRPRGFVGLRRWTI